MKKNRMMRLASLLLVCVLLTTSVISGTFAKYTTNKTGSDTARVAHWGVTITPNGTMFEKVYGKDDASYTLGANTVETSDEWKLVAPGTTDSLTEIVLQGSPEVATRVTYDATVNLDGWKLSDGTTEYCPVYFTIEGKTYGIDADCGMTCDVKATSVADLATKVEEAIEACKKDYAPNTDLYAMNGDYPSVTWEWPFYTDDDHDVKDTDLGDKAAAGNHAVVQVTVKTTVEQIN